MGEGSASASSIVCPVSATIQTCLNGACAGAVDESPVAGVSPLSDPESPDVGRSGVEVGGVEVSGAELAGVEVSGAELSARRGVGRASCRRGGVGRWAATERGRGRRLLRGGRRGRGRRVPRRSSERGAAEASVASACGPAAAPAAIPKPSISSVATPATRRRGQRPRGRRDARRGGGPARAGGAAVGAASARVRERVEPRRPAALAAAQAVALVGRERLAARRAGLARGSEHRGVEVDGGHGGGPAKGRARASSPARRAVV